MDTMKGKPDFDTKTQTQANNKPVGAAGQPFNNSSLKKEVPEAKAGAIARRMAKSKKKGKSN
ncbi:hypothetical protein [Streptomyces anandii]|uniref:hypothetical protein n=1 Tax=Streptomyces anandii TaxID=285454 RepID=UPI0036C40D6C